MKKILSVFILSVLFSSFTYGQDFSIDKSENPNYIQGEVIVKYKDSSKTKKDTKSKGISVFDAELGNNNLDIKQKLNNNGDIVLVEINNGNSVEETIDLLKNDPNIEYVEPNFVRYLFSGETSYNITEKTQWALNAISWYDAFNTYSGDLKTAEPVVAGVMDNGVNYNHPDLVNSLWNSSSCSLLNKSLDCEHGFDFFHWKSTPLANSDSHGTHVAGIIAAEANNGIGITGVNPYAKIAALKIGDGVQLSSADELSAIYFAIENGIKLINASLGGTSPSYAEYYAIEDFGNVGGLFIAAAGNEEINVDNHPVYPCSYDLDNIICVADVNQSNVLSSYTNGGSNYGVNNVDIAAPGSSIISTVTKYTLKWKFREYFNKNLGRCTTGWQNLDGWDLIGTGGCSRVSKYDANDYGYFFVDTLTSPLLSGDLNSTFSMYIYCDGGANLSLQYSTGDSEYKTFYNLTGIDGDGIFHAELGEFINDDISDKFSLRFKITNNTNPISNFCAVDDVEIYNDPYSSGSDNIYAEKSGTSMATPHVVGLASMAWMLNPDLTNIDVKKLILDNGDVVNGLLSTVKDGKVINVKKTLDEAIKIASPSGLDSSWSGYIQWDSVSKAQGYYYEIFSGDIIVDSGTINNTGVQTNLSGDYVWRVKSIAHTSGYDSNFSTGYICSKPILNISNLVGDFSGYECSNLIGDFTFSDNCSNNYEMGRVGGTGVATLNKSGVVIKQIYIRNSFGEESIWDIDYYFNDTIPTLNSGSYTHDQLLNSLSSIGNALTLFGAIDGVCGSSTISVSGISCNEGQGSISGNNINITPPSNKNGSSYCSVKFNDDEGNEILGTLNYSYDTVQTINNGGGGGSGGGGGTTTQTATNGGGGGGGLGGGGGGDSYSCKNLPANATANNKTTPKSNTNYSYNTDTFKVCTFQCNSGYTRDVKNGKCEKTQVTTGNVINTGDILQNIEIEKTKQIELFNETDTSNNSTSNIDFSRFNESNPSSILPNGFTVEFNNAYEFAHRVGITTTDSIEKANMNGELTRIAMAKMLSQYAINILEKKPDTSKNPEFEDVSRGLDAQYNNGITLAYQLGIMGIGINKFRPNDKVTRKEFGTALSRMLYDIADGQGLYYSTHLAKLKKEGIINNDNPELTELRGYVMTMLMRSAK